MDVWKFFSEIEHGKLSGPYYLYGQEEYSKISAVQKILSLPQESTRDLNVQIFKSPNLDPVEIRNACQALPFFDAFRVVVVRDLDGNSEKSIAGILEDVPDSTILLLVRSASSSAKQADSGSDKKGSSSPLLSALNPKNRAVNFAPLDDAHLYQFIQKRLDAYHLKAEPGLIPYLAGYAGRNLSYLSNSVLKLRDYAGEGNTVTKKMVEFCITPDSEYQYYSIADLILSGKLEDGLKQLNIEFRNRRESPVGFLHYLNKQVLVLIAIKQMLVENRPQDELVPKSGSTKNSIRFNIAKAQRFSLESLCRIHEELTDEISNITKGVYRDEDALMLLIYQIFKETRK